MRRLPACSFWRTSLAASVLCVLASLPLPAFAQFALESQLAAPSVAPSLETLQAARIALSRYEAGAATSLTLEWIAKLGVLSREPSLSRVDQEEARFLRAAAATDLLILAHVRNDAKQQALVEQALAVPPGGAFAHLSEELSTFTISAYREVTAQLRSTLASAAEREAWPVPRLQKLEGSQRDVLFAHAFVQAASEGSLLSSLARYGVDPCSGDAKCAPAYAPFDTRGRMAVRALEEVGQALLRLQDAARVGDPLAKSAGAEIAVLEVLVLGIELEPSPRSLAGDGWVDAHGAALARAPELVFYVAENSLEYQIVPRVRLNGSGQAALFTRHEGLPLRAPLALSGPLQPFLHPMPELVRWLKARAAGEERLEVAVVARPEASALMLGRTLCSLERARFSSLLVAGQNARGQWVAHPVTLTLRDEEEVAARLALRVRLGGYSLRLPGAATLDIPRIRETGGFRFDDEALASRLQAARVGTSQISFMPEVSSATLTRAVFEVARRSSTLELVLPSL